MIPLFQRPFTWGEANFESLWNDVIEVYEAEAEEQHFLGSIVTKVLDATPQGVSRFLVIDGQQRLTTLIILLAALRDVARDSDPQLSDMIHRLYLTNEFVPDGYHYKLLPTQLDRSSYQAIIENGESSRDDSRPRKAYEYFRRRINHDSVDGEAIDLRKLQQIITGHLEIVSITLEDSDNEYRIFESLNATGTPLTQADLLRNYFFMRLPVSEHDVVYNEVWAPMQESLAGSLEPFFRYEYMSSGQFVRQADVYMMWKRRLDPMDTARLGTTLRELAHDGHLYRRLISPDAEIESALSEGLKRLNRWGGQTVHPFLLNVYRRYDAGEVSAEQFAEVLWLIESFLVRRFFVRIPTNQLNRLFMRLAYQLPEGYDIVEATWLALSDPGRRWPDDEAFRESILTFPLYTEGRYEQRRLILETLEQSYGSRERVDLSSLTIEHIMPQTLTEEWEHELGEDARELHQKKLHLLGNLTLTGYNPELSNSPFEVKKSRFSQSNVEMNKEIAQELEWTGTQIDKRGRDLAERAIRMWSGPIR